MRPTLSNGSGGRVAWIATVVVAALALAGGWWMWRPAPVVETVAPAVTQEDGSKILERKPKADAKPAHKVPRGAKVERIEQVTVQGQGLVMPSGEVKDCPPVTVDMTVVREADGAKRVIASSPDGQIIAGVDIPVETAAPPPEPPKWAAGLSFDPTNQTTGVWMERDLSRFRVGVDLNQTRRGIGGPLGVEARMRIGWTF